MYIKGNLLDHDGPIAHGVNCQGKMNSGVAKAIREKYPEHYRHYKSLINKGKLTEVGTAFCRPGHVLDNTSKVTQAVWGLATQKFYGYDGKRYVNYSAIGRVFKFLDTMYYMYPIKHVLGIPKIGAGLGGGDWSIIEQIINDATPKLEIWVYEL